MFITQSPHHHPTKADDILLILETTDCKLSAAERAEKDRGWHDSLARVLCGAQHSCTPSTAQGPSTTVSQATRARGNSRPSHPLPFRLCSGPWGPTLPQGQEQSFGWEGCSWSSGLLLPQL